MDARKTMNSRRLLPLILLSAGLATGAQAAPERFEEVDLPASIRSGVDLIHIDEDASPAPPARDALAEALSLDDKLGAPVDLLQPMHPLYTELRRSLVRYRQRWGGLPEVQIPEGPAMRQGADGERVALLRQRLGLDGGTRFDAALAKAVRDYQRAHGLGIDGIVDVETIASLNLGADHYEKLILVNLERARALPSRREGKYIVVDAAAARLWLYEDGEAKDSMRTIVGSKAQATPMLAATIRFAEVNPYWNVPPDLVARLIAPRVLEYGTGYLRDRRYEILSGWTDDAVPLDPETIDWQAVAAGEQDLRVRQLPGAGNSMGKIKFMMPNSYGIYLHDTPNKALFAEEDRWISNGCVRVEDARRLAAWLFGEMPEARDPDRDEQVPLEEPVPVYITYLTAAPGEDGEVQFRADRYDRDRRVMARMFGAGPAVETASRQ